MTHEEFISKYGSKYEAKNIKTKQLVETIWNLQVENKPIIKPEPIIKVKKPVKPINKKPRNKYSKDMPSNYKSYLGRANKRKFPFDFTVNEFLQFIAQDCFYCGKLEANGIDRIDSKTGYTKDNSVPCCFMCNTMKYTYSIQKFLTHINTIYSYQKQK
jgi:hypothetical protein